MTGNVASQALEIIHKQLLIDEEWTVRSATGFSWLAYRLRQDFSVSPPIHSSGMEIFRVSCIIPVVEDIRADPQQVVAFLGALNRFSVGESFVWDAQSRAIHCCINAIVHAETLGWRAAQLGHYAVLALRNCEDKAEKFAELLQGSVALRSHPEHGRREHPDDILWVGERVFLPSGEEPSRFAVADDFQQVFELVENTRYFSAGGSADGIAIEVPFGPADTCLIQLHSSVAHPVLGNGLLSTLKARIPAGIDSSAAELTSRLNTLEAEGAFASSSFGAWCVDSIGEEQILAHARFTPNLMYLRGLSSDVATIYINRALWLAEVLLGPEENRVRIDAAEIALNRFAFQDRDLL